MSLLLRIVVRAALATLAGLMVVVIAWTVLHQLELSALRIAASALALFALFAAIAFGRERDRMASTTYNVGLPIFVGVIGTAAVLAHDGPTAEGAIRIATILSSIAIGMLAIRLSERTRPA
jgi:hypothetical protein